MSPPDATPKKEQLRVLNLEDNPGDSELIKAELETEWKEVVLLRVGTRDALVQALDEFKPDVVLSAFRLHDFDGRAALNIVRQTHPYIPVIMVTGVLADIEAVDLVKMGAADYVMKDRLQHLSSAVQGALSGEQGIRARKAMEHALRESEVRYQAIMSSVNDAIVCIRPDDIIYLWNRKAEEMFGYTAAEAIGRNLHQLIIPEQYIESAAEALPQFAKTGSGTIVGTTRELTVRRKDNSEFPVELSVSSMNINGEWHATGIIRDITERKQSEAKIQRLNRLYALLSQCNQIIVRSVNETELFAQICQSSVQFGGFSMVWIGLIDPDTRMLVPAASRGEGVEAYLREIKISASADSEYGGGPAGISIRENRPFWCQDFQNSSLTAPWRERAAIPGWRSAASLPLRREGVVIGTLMLYSSELNVFDEDTRGLLTEMNADIDFALDNFGHEAERRRAEKALSDSRNLLKTIIDTSPVRLFWKDKELRYMGCNPGFARDAGEADPEHLIGKDDFQLGWKEQAELYRADDRRVMDTGVPKLSYDEMRTAPDGTAIWFRTSKLPLRNAANETIGVLGMYEDITERRHAEDELRQLSLAVEQSPNSIVITDLDANLEYVNDAFVNATGYSRAEVIGQNPRILHSGKTSRATYDDMWAHLTRGEVWKGEFFNRRKDGSEFIESILASPVRDADGRTTHYLGIKEDITERRQAERMLRDSRESLERLLNSMAEGVYGIDTDGNCTFVNRAFLQSLGYQSDDELLGKHIHDIIHHSRADGSPYPESECRIYRAYRLRQMSSAADEVFWRKDGVAIPVEYWSHPIIVDGVVVGAITTFIDITERKQIEAQLAAEYQHVAGMNAQLIESNKKLEQAQNQLLQSEKMAAVGLLAAGVAHEINNPVGYVNSNLGTLEKYLADIFVVMDKYEAAEAQLGADKPQLEELRRFKAKIDLGYIREDTRSLIAESHQGLERVKRIVLDLKEFSHAESEDHWVWADVHQGLESTLNVVWNELKYKCEVVKEYGILPKIYCLPAQLDQVFMNLLVNAAQAIEVRGKITLRTGQEGDRVWIEVSDTGKGIPPEDMLRLFNPFFTTKPVGQGTGLGLAVSYRIMEKHHGKIEVKSEVGKGSTFRVWLPVQQPNTQE